MSTEPRREQRPETTNRRKENHWEGVRPPQGHPSPNNRSHDVAAEVASVTKNVLPKTSNVEIDRCGLPDQCECFEFVVVLDSLSFRNANNGEGLLPGYSFK